MSVENCTEPGLFHFLVERRILVCKSCAAGIVPKHLITHIRSNHRHYSSDFRTKRSTADSVQDVLLPSLPGKPSDPSLDDLPIPPPDEEALPALKIHTGYGCTHCHFVTKREDNASRHYNSRHAPVRRGPGAVSNAKGALRQRLDREHHGGQPPYVPAFYQRLFTAGIAGSVSFRVKKMVSAKAGSRPRRDHEYTGGFDRELVADVVLNKLAALEASQLREDHTISNEATRCQVYPWLERTRWLHYLEGIPLNEAANVDRLPHRLDEPLLDKLGIAIDRVVEAAYDSLCTEKVDFFGQRCISSQSLLQTVQIRNNPHAD